MFVIGTAGHVDHGKSTLVKALTGIDPDRLREEKEREMTIDLGFAWLTLPSGREVSIVDVPGHERFIKNMLAGVGGIDLAMLVVAADESVMLQTREHLAILDLLGVRRGLVAITKRDLVDSELLELVQAEVEGVLKGTSLEGAPMVAVSAVTGEGLDELKARLDRLLEETQPRRDVGRPRLPVDRAFVMSGFGTVVTGTLIDGSLAVGQEVELVPTGLRGRVRGLQSHRRRVESVEPGRRVAVNISGVSHDQVVRGHVLTTPGWLRATDTVDVRLRVTPWTQQPVRHSMGVTFHTGTSEALARVRLLDAEELAPGQEGWAQLHLEKSVAVVKGDSFVVRSPQWTLGGGTIVEAFPRRHRRFHKPTLERLTALASGSPREALLRALESLEPAELSALAALAHLPEGNAKTEVEAMAAEGLVVVLGGKGVVSGAFVFTAGGWGRLKEKATQALAVYHRQHLLRRGMPREELRGRLGLSAAAFPQVLALLSAEGVASEEGALVRSPGHRPQLSQEQRQAAEGFVRALERQPYSPPTDMALDAEVLSFLAEEGLIVRVSETVAFAAQAYREMEERIVTRIREQGKVTVGEVRDMFNTSRKYALALLEHLDQRHITRRVGDDRVLMR